MCEIDITETKGSRSSTNAFKTGEHYSKQSDIHFPSAHLCGPGGERDHLLKVVFTVRAKEFKVKVSLKNLTAVLCSTLNTQRMN